MCRLRVMQLWPSAPSAVSVGSSHLMANSHGENRLTILAAHTCRLKPPLDPAHTAAERSAEEQVHRLKAEVHRLQVGWHLSG